MSLSFQNQKAVIIGGTSGIGKATAIQILKQGGRVLLVGRDATKLQSTLDELNKLGTAVGERADITQPAERHALIHTLNQTHSDANLLVNAAGVFLPKPFIEHREIDYDLYLDLNKALFFITQAFARNIISRNGKGAIVNIGSMWAKQAIKSTPSSAYSMAKAGLHSLTQHLAMELADHNIRVNAVSPAVVETPIYENFIPPEEVHTTLQGFNSFHPIGRVGMPFDIAKTVVFLLSEQSSWTTGAVWDVDGGVMAGRNQ